MSRFNKSRRVVKGGRRRSHTPLERRVAWYLAFIKGASPSKVAAFHKPGSMKKKGK
jgi:hypothetical protein